MFSITPRLAMLTAVFAFSSLNLASSVYAQTDAKTNKAQAVAASKVKGLLYEVQIPAATAKGADKKKPTKFYLFGSIHIARADFYPMSPAVLRAYKQADAVAVEADVSNTETSSEIVEKLSYVSPNKLESHLSPATWESLKSMAGANTEQFQRFKPVMVAMGLTISVGQQMGFEPSQGIDLHFILQSRKDKKELLELEGVSLQANVLGDLSDAEGDALLAAALDSVRKGDAPKELNRIADSWKQADANALGQILREAGNRDAGSQALMKRLMDDRNAPIVEKIAKFAADGKKLFVVLGAGHLAGENSVLSLMQQQGWQVKQIR